MPEGKRDLEEAAGKEIEERLTIGTAIVTSFDLSGP